MPLLLEVWVSAIMVSPGHTPGSSWSRPGSPASTTIKCLASAAGDFLESLTDLGYLTARIPVTVEAVADWLPNFRHLENSEVWLGLTVNALVTGELKQLSLVSPVLNDLISTAILFHGSLD